MNKNAVLFAVIVVSLAALIYLSVTGGGMQRPQALPLGQSPSAPDQRAQAPDFTLPDTEGDKVSLSDFRDKVVVLNFWTTNCGPCLAEMPALSKLYANLSGEDFEIIAVTMDPGRPAERKIRELGLEFPVVFDGSDRVANSYRVRGTPTSFILDKKGMVVERVEGPIAWDDPSVVKYLEELIKE